MQSARPASFGLGYLTYRTEDDRVYVANLRRILDNLRTRKEEPSEAIIAWGSSILPDGFTQWP